MRLYLGETVRPSGFAGGLHDRRGGCRRLELAARRSARRMGAREPDRFLRLYHNPASSSFSLSSTSVGESLVYSSWCFLEKLITAYL